MHKPEVITTLSFCKYASGHIFRGLFYLTPEKMGEPGVFKQWVNVVVYHIFSWTKETVVLPITDTRHQFDPKKIREGKYWYGPKYCYTHPSGV